MKNEDKAITGGTNNEWFNVFHEARKPFKKAGTRLRKTTCNATLIKASSVGFNGPSTTFGGIQTLHRLALVNPGA